MEATREVRPGVLFANDGNACVEADIGGERWRMSKQRGKVAAGGSARSLANGDRRLHGVTILVTDASAYSTSFKQVSESSPLCAVK